MAKHLQNSGMGIGVLMRGDAQHSTGQLTPFPHSAADGDPVPSSSQLQKPTVWWVVGDCGRDHGDVAQDASRGFQEDIVPAILASAIRLP
jgi:hypothetical protein